MLINGFISRRRAFLLFPKQGMYFGNFLCLTNPPRLTSALILLEYPPPPPARDGAELRSAENSIAHHLVVRAVVGCAYNSSMLPLKVIGDPIA